MLVEQKPVCAECGSDDIDAHALLHWNTELQDWQISDDTCGRATCSGCGNTDVMIKWINS